MLKNKHITITTTMYVCMYGVCALCVCVFVCMCMYVCMYVCVYVLYVCVCMYGWVLYPSTALLASLTGW